MPDRKGSREVTAEVAKGLPGSQGLSGMARKDSLAIFCDFDGTFSVQDVGGQVAQTHLPEKRAHLMSRYQEGELDAWEYALELFDGFEFSAESMEALLRTIDLDPGARDLLAWCESRGVPFQILSDGFDYNLKRLQEIHGIRFDHASNRLELEGDRWRLSPGGRNPECTCGTGFCKRRRIEAFRQQAPSTLCIHIGNGRVSDLCGAEAADVAFAKDTLSEALREKGVFFYPFETLHDVISRMDEGFPALI